MSPAATLVILGIASIIWFGFLRRHLAGKNRGDGGGSEAYSGDGGHRDHDRGDHDSGDGGDGGGDGGGD